MLIPLALFGRDELKPVLDPKLPHRHDHGLVVKLHAFDDIAAPAAFEQPTFEGAKNCGVEFVLDQNVAHAIDRHLAAALAQRRLA